MLTEFEIYTDGGARGNPGPAACAVVVFEKGKKGKKIAEFGKFLGRATNNQAEYQGVLQALLWLEQQEKSARQINFFLDSKLIVEQLSGRFKLKNEGLKMLFWQIQKKIMSLGLTVNFKHIPREQNQEADKIVNEILDKEKK
ncbi:MAG: fructose-2 6-bisphosphatase-like protein [Candidatus Berkelbacteria bacterium Licking1014_7]|uniref:Fructose-2 6-bisphosphatase-like protein n=1 Tax=Candidatus Berkelbacteria bacterium Licking1014_7 TaxID=2017147 RepID=A0A554LHM0_9BACT|nr:MAG: fructose-2 6-bisphosphatase-like protein [Candidatus Berkelbacteria bacterium Licking1014_7]